MADLVLDTDVTSLMWRDALPRRIDRQLLGRKAAVTFVTLGEALAGAYGAGWTHQRRDGLHAFYEHTFGSLGWRHDISEAYGDLRGRAAAAGYALGQNDRWIAACCIGHELPLLTRNRKHSEPLRPPGLMLR